MITGLALITSLGCSLKCSYCNLSKQEQQLTHLNLQKENIKALQDGTFIKNVKKVLDKFDISPENIHSLVFWGMEPTLTLKYITQHMREWFEAFPNWNNCFFSTNGQQNYDDICNFIITATKYCQTNFSMQIQASYDGPVFTSKNRKAKIYLHNLQDRLNTINKKYKFFLNVWPHGVLTEDVINYLNDLTEEELINYFQQQQEELFTYQEDSHFNFKNLLSYGLEMPHEYTKETGIHLAELINKLSQSQNKLLQLYGNRIVSLFKNDINRCNDNIQTWSSFCGNGTDGLYIRYDGALVNCTNTIFLDYNNYDERSFHNFIQYTNQLNADNYQYFWNVLNYQSQQFQVNVLIKTLQYLAELNEIDQSYLDINKCKKHLRYIFDFGSCFENYYKLTQSFMINPYSKLKLMCNGLCDLLEKADD